jgi:hypothetical protein
MLQPLLICISITLKKMMTGNIKRNTSLWVSSRKIKDLLNIFLWNNLEQLLRLMRIWIWPWILVFNTTYSNISAISWRPVLVVEEAGVPGENHRKIAYKHNIKIINSFSLSFLPLKEGVSGTNTFVVLRLVTNVALIEGGMGRHVYPRTVVSSS